MSSARIAAVALLAASACAGSAPPPPAPPASTPTAAIAPCSGPSPRAIALSNDADRKMSIDIEGAIALYQEAARLAPDEPHIAAKLATAYRKKEDWVAMAAALEGATARMPAFGNLWFSRGYALEQLAKKGTVPWAEARAPFERCIELDPHFADCHQQLGNVLVRLDDESGALKSYTRAVKADPAAAHRYAALADLYMQLDRLVEARAVLEQAKIFARPDDKGLVSIYMLSAAVHDAHGELGAMVSDLEEAMRATDPASMEHTQLQFTLGSTYARLSPPRKQESIALLKSFNARACKGSKAALFRTECEVVAALVTKLGGSLQ